MVVTPTVDARKLRAEFPIFEQRMHGKALAHVDSATSAQKPKVRPFVNATSTQGIPFTRSATEGLNLVAYV